MTGILLVDKPAEWTSMDVCAHLRGILHEKHVGHTGTLDPNATGLLVVLAGKATKAAKFAESDVKEYTARLHLGTVTDTQDIWGTVLEQNVQKVTRQQLESVLPRFRGGILQLPPMYSAIKIRGQKLYQIARRGGEVERELRPITIEKLEVSGFENDEWILDIRCSKGTYVRTLCADIGAALGCGGCMSALRRTAAGRFSVSQAHTLDEIRADPEAYLLPVECLTGEQI
jgi:tRNA pseudouridine 55 synthase